MGQKEGRISDFIDLGIWKKLQDTFAQSIRTPVVTIDEEGNELAASRNFPFYCELIKKEPKHFHEFFKAPRIENLKKLKETKEKIVFYYCNAGLLNAMVPLIVNNEYVGAVAAEAMILDPGQNTEKARKVSLKTGIGVDELIDAMNEIRPQKKDDVKIYGELLCILSNTLPELVYQKAQSEKKISKLTILHKITGLVNSTLELNNILTSIMTFLVDSIMCDGSSVIIPNKEANCSNRYALNERFNSDFFMKLEEASSMQANKTKESVTLPIISGSHEDNAATMLTFPLKIKDEVIGTLNLYGGKELQRLDKDSLEFISIIVNQATTAITNARQYEQIKELAIRDKLTSLYNRRHFMEILQRELVRARTSKKTFSVAMIDVDDFREYNNLNGHPAGDELLKQIAQMIKDYSGPVDTVGRYGGEEFIIIMPDKDLNEAKASSERIRKAIEMSSFAGEEKLSHGAITISIGALACRDLTLSPEQIIKKADQALYKAKAAGKNMVVAEAAALHDVIK